ncbi:class I SAM-dependent methyltransferase [Corynebacterium suedekumii]|uniref:Class I SAM-dependent methyltransferase n=1 Tax=Corynebacterium suedekumii TaxID=3049801 RepID=A0ABY8VNG3_9CORY|nr:class I SAM-dependent methyltransferase [Corynebacterium suedekumii]WIM69709.1 class I SAM-dependent methyltransferase [Corynebacterium suedekumii]WIM72465.1 class I SAM-dependent methyltransferase [Corynebacterium suedekumii]
MPTWKEVTAANPAHSENYARRWRMMAEQGEDIDGEARLVDALSPRAARILDAGCGTGRLGGYLTARGHDVVGTDIDPVLIEHARRDHPDARWEVGDLSVDPVPVSDVDVAVSAGNVMGFLAPEGREAALRNIAGSLAADGRFVVGFGAGRGWGFDDFIATAERVGLELENVFESWDLHPFTADSDFLVAIFRNDADG